MVTAETAIVLPVVLFVAAILTGVIGIVTMQAQVNAAAHDGARLLSRGESTSRAVQVVRRALPGAVVVVSRHGDDVTVQVSRRFAVPAAPRMAVTLRGRATGSVE